MPAKKINTAEAANATETAEVKKPAKKAKKSEEVTYTIAELSGAARKLFDVMPECVTAALTVTKRTRFSVDEAKSIVKNFMKKEVK